MASEPHAAKKIPMFPLSAVLYPGGVLPLHVFEERYKKLSQYCIDSGSQFGIVLIERGQEVGGGDARFPVGCMAEIIQHDLMPDGRSNLLVLGTSKINIEQWHSDSPFPVASVREVHDASTSGSMERAQVVLRRFSDFVESARRMGYQMPAVDEDAISVGLEATELIYRIAELLPAGPFDRQRILAAAGCEDRLTVIEDQLRGLEEILVTRDEKP